MTAPSLRCRYGQSPSISRCARRYAADHRTMKTTKYFDMLRSRPDRVWIKDDWIRHVVLNYECETIQKDGRIRRWASIEAAESRYLRVILLEDGETVHNAFFDRGYKP